MRLQNIPEWIATAAALIGSLTAFPLPIAASEGVLEINQTCAVNTGCFAGDAAGYPVTIDGAAGRSYRLTGDLDLTAESAATSAIALQAGVTLDLAGFSITGPATCTGTGASLSCGPAGAGTGVSLDAGSRGSSVRNGRIQGMGSSGVSGAASQVTIEGIQAINNVLDGIGGQADMIVRGCRSIGNGRDGIRVDEGSLVESSVSVGNGGDGVETDGASTVVRSISARGNGAAGIRTQDSSIVSAASSSKNTGEGFVLGNGARYESSTSRANGLADRCGGGLCSDRRRFYLTQQLFSGANALTACDAGFHMASMWEIQATGNLDYDGSRTTAVVKDDSGRGAPGDVGGWVRTGFSNSSGTGLGQDNCNVWTNSSATGTVASLEPTWLNSADRISPWSAGNRLCSFLESVWCVEDQ